VQCLELALWYLGKALSSSPQFRAREIELWNNRVEEPLMLFLPLPLHSLQGHLEQLRAILKRMNERKVSADWRKSMLAVTKEIAASLSAMASARS